MATAGDPQIEVIAMHGWAGDSRCWVPWIEATKNLGWNWQCGERGYGAIEPNDPVWTAKSGARRMVVGHSLGPHLIAPEVLQHAELVVLLASFAAFVPPDRSERRIRAALEGMSGKLKSQSEARGMLEKFLANAAAPQSVRLMPPGPTEGPLSLDRLRADLEFLLECRELPAGFPARARVLLVEAGEDRIVEQTARAILFEALPGADLIRYPDAGHALLQTDVIRKVTAWAAAAARRGSGAATHREQS